MTDTVATAAGGAEFSVGKVLRDTFSTYFGNIVTFTLLGILVYIPIAAITAAVIGVGTQSVLQQVDPVTNPAGFSSMVGTVLYASLGIGILTIIIGALINAGITFGAIETLSGRRFGFGALISRAFSAFLPIILATIVIGIISSIGFVLLIVPGIILLLMFSITIPVIIAERQSPLDAMSRSRSLTSGHRWAILGGYIVCAIAMIVISYAVQLAAVFLGPVIVLVASIFTNSINAAITGSFTAAVYVNLRMTKEGAGIEELAAVFD